MRAVSNPYYTGRPTDHFDGTRFFNPNGIEPGGFGDLLRWQFSKGRIKWDKHYENKFPPAVPDSKIEGDALRVTMVGHASLLIQTAGINILTDPVWSNRVSPFSFIGPKRTSLPGIAFSALPPIDVVLITHNHYDHLDLDTLKALNLRHHPLLVMPLGNDTIVEDAAPGARMAVLDWGDGINISEGMAVYATPCHHWSARGMNDRRMALWCAFVITTPSGNLYHIGDTGFHDGINYRAAAEAYGGFRLATLPIGAYEPRWFMKSQHQNPEEAVEGMLLCNAAYALGHHWGAFQLTDEGREDPPTALTAALTKRSIEPTRFRAMHPGEVFDIPLG
ncbi:MBL fold metallo-hydrolase [Rhizobium sp. CFBP 8762]|uniref:MBL fold metallo-hydrolase n=1 Tax=Rhizobium sp. CFBP 8762 TaxID=2775279 RepID=UPI00313B0061